MKKLAIALLLSAAIMMTGCQGNKTGDTPAASKTEEVDQASSELKEKLGDGYILPSEAVTKVLAKKWDVVGTDSIYDFKEDGTGTMDGKALTFECGFDEDNNITIGIKMESAKKEQLYAIENDTTGYGLKLRSLDGGKDMELFQSDIERLDIGIKMESAKKEQLYAIENDTTGYGLKLRSLDGGKDMELFQSDIERLDLSDKEAEGLLGTWKDGNENEYILKKDGSALIKGSSGKTEGTFGVVRDAQGTLKLNLVMEGGSLEYEYTLSEDHTALELCSPGTDTIHRWTKA